MITEHPQPRPRAITRIINIININNVRKVITPMLKFTITMLVSVVTVYDNAVELIEGNK